jgi:biotin carboxylase
LDTTHFCALLGAGDPLYREYALAALGEFCDVVLVAAETPEWARPYVHTMVAADPRDPRAALAALRGTGLPLAGVLTYDEFSVESAARVAAELGLPGSPPAVAQRCRDKRQMRAAFEAAGVASPVSVATTTLSEVEPAAARTGYPLVLKPAALAGSIGVVLVQDPGELREAYRKCRASGRAEYGAVSDVVLVEEYVDGPEISVESLVRAGEAWTVALTRKRLVPPPWFEESGHVVVGDMVDDSIGRLAEQAQRALGIEWGATHTEIRLGAGGPRVIEVAARPAGDVIPLLVRLTTGVDLTVAAAAGAMGLPVPAAREPVAPAAAVRFFFPDKDMVFRSASSDIAAAAPQWLRSFVIEAADGDVLRLPPHGFLNRVGYAIVTGTNEAECERKLDDVEGSLHIFADPFIG